MIKLRVVLQTTRSRRVTGNMHLKKTNSPLHDDKRLLAIPPSYSQVADYNSNQGQI